MKKIKLVAEIGWNHMGSISLAEKMITAASKSGADYAKFQTWQVKNLKPGPWDKDGRREIYEKAELNKIDYKKLAKICKYHKIKFLTSLFNHNDFELIKDLNLKEIKIPSPENRNKELLQFCSKNFKDIYLSTGAASITEVKNEKDLKLKGMIESNLKFCLKTIQKGIENSIFRNKNISLTDLSEQLNIPKSHLSFVFKYHSPLNFSEFLQRVRIYDAQEMIKSDYLKMNNMDTLAPLLGFPHIPLFINLS